MTRPRRPRSCSRWLSRPPPPCSLPHLYRPWSSPLTIRKLAFCCSCITCPTAPHFDCRYQLSSSFHHNQLPTPLYTLHCINRKTRGLDRLGSPVQLALHAQRLPAAGSHRGTASTPEIVLASIHTPLFDIGTLLHCPVCMPLGHIRLPCMTADCLLA